MPGIRLEQLDLESLSKYFETRKDLFNDVTKDKLLEILGCLSIEELNALNLPDYIINFVKQSNKVTKLEDYEVTESDGTVYKIQPSKGYLKVGDNDVLVYQHPIYHNANEITQTYDRQFASQDEKTNWNSKVSQTQLNNLSDEVNLYLELLRMQLKKLYYEFHTKNEEQELTEFFYALNTELAKNCAYFDLDCSASKTSYKIFHGLNTDNIQVFVTDKNGMVVYPTILIEDNNIISINFTSTNRDDTYRVIITAKVGNTLESYDSVKNIISNSFCIIGSVTGNNRYAKYSVKHNFNSTDIIVTIIQEDEVNGVKCLRDVSAFTKIAVYDTYVIVSFGKVLTSSDKFYIFITGRPVFSVSDDEENNFTELPDKINKYVKAHDIDLNEIFSEICKSYTINITPDDGKESGNDKVYSKTIELNSELVNNNYSMIQVVDLRDNTIVYPEIINNDNKITLNFLNLFTEESYGEYAGQDITEYNFRVVVNRQMLVDYESTGDDFVQSVYVSNKNVELNCQYVDRTQNVTVYAEPFKTVSEHDLIIKNLNERVVKVVATKELNSSGEETGKYNLELIPVSEGETYISIYSYEDYTINTRIKVTTINKILMEEVSACSNNMKINNDKKKEINLNIINGDVEEKIYFDVLPTSTTNKKLSYKLTDQTVNKVNLLDIIDIDDETNSIVVKTNKRKTTKPINLRVSCSEDENVYEDIFINIIKEDIIPECIYLPNYKCYADSSISADDHQIYIHPGEEIDLRAITIPMGASEDYFTYELNIAAGNDTKLADYLKLDGSKLTLDKDTNFDEIPFIATSGQDARVNITYNDGTTEVKTLTVTIEVEKDYESTMHSPYASLHIEPLSNFGYIFGKGVEELFSFRIDGLRNMKISNVRWFITSEDGNEIELETLYNNSICKLTGIDYGTFKLQVQLDYTSSLHYTGTLKSVLYTVNVVDGFHTVTEESRLEHITIPTDFINIYNKGNLLEVKLSDFNSINGSIAQVYLSIDYFDKHYSRLGYETFNLGYNYNNFNEINLGEIINKYDSSIHYITIAAFTDYVVDNYRNCTIDYRLSYVLNQTT